MEEEIVPAMITSKTAKYVFQKMFDTGKSSMEIINEENLWSMDFVAWCVEHPDFIRQTYEDWLSGKK